MDSGHPEYAVIAAILAGVIVRAWWAHERRQGAERKVPDWRPAPPSDDRPLWPVDDGATGVPSRAGWRSSWRAWSIGGLAAYSALYAVAYELGVR